MIFDRTQADVEYALAHPDSTEFLKGALNYTDLNRIELKYIEIVEKLALIGIQVTINPIKTFSCNTYTDIYNDYYSDYEDVRYQDLLDEDSWTCESNISITDIDTIQSNVLAIQEAMEIDSEIVIDFTDSINYIQLNNLEKILYDADAIINEQLKAYAYCGTIYCGEEALVY